MACFLLTLYVFALINGYLIHPSQKVSTDKKGKTMTKQHTLSRRRFLKTLGTMSLAAGIGPAIIIPGRAQADQKTLENSAVEPFYS